MDARAIIEHLGLVPHPEGGHYVEMWRDAPSDGSRGVGSAIYFLLAAGERSHWHRVDADEHWFFHAGAPLRLSQAADDVTRPTSAMLGADLAAGQHPQLRVPKDWWQSAESTGAWTLVSCTVSPAFRFESFVLAPEGFEPGRESTSEPEATFGE